MLRLTASINSHSLLLPLSLPHLNTLDLQASSLTILTKPPSPFPPLPPLHPLPFPDQAGEDMDDEKRWGEVWQQALLSSLTSPRRERGSVWNGC